MDITIFASGSNSREPLSAKGVLYEDGTVIVLSKFCHQDGNSGPAARMEGTDIGSYLIRMPDGSERQLDPALLMDCCSTQTS